MKQTIITFILVAISSTAFGQVFKADCSGAMYSKFGVEVKEFHQIPRIISGGFSSVFLGYDLTEDFYVSKSVGDGGSPEYVFSKDFRSPGGYVSMKLVGRILTISSPNPHYDGLQLRCHRSDLEDNI